jgi:hypothetical protein
MYALPFTGVAAHNRVCSDGFAAYVYRASSWLAIDLYCSERVRVTAGTRFAADQRINHAAALLAVAKAPTRSDLWNFTASAGRIMLAECTLAQQLLGYVLYLHGQGRSRTRDVLRLVHVQECSVALLT